jgi:hypothetical protein
VCVTVIHANPHTLQHNTHTHTLTIHTNTHTYQHAHTHTHTHSLRDWLCDNNQKEKSMYDEMMDRLNDKKKVYTHVCVCVCVYVCVCVCVCVCLECVVYVWGVRVCVA